MAWSVAALAAAGCGPSEPPPPPPLVPQVAGTLAVPGLSAPVVVIRDRWGIPHIDAASQSDLFIAQGFVQAQDRLFQMDLWRRSVQGRLAEVLGANFIERDAMTRRVQYRGDLDVEWASYGPDARAIATAFVTGVNAWVDLAREQPPEEFVLAGWLPEPWAPEDLLNRTDAFVSSLPGAQDDVFRARLVTAVGTRAADRLVPLRGRLTSSVPAGLEPGVVSPIVAAAIGRVGTPPFFRGLAARVSPPQSTLDRPAGARDAGSNAWAVRGTRSTTGSPLLATDPHRRLANPSLRYLVHLQAPGWHVTGATAPWLPGVAIGHNEHIAWSATAIGVDTQDLYVERMNPANPRQVWNGGRWVDMESSPQVIGVKGRAEPFEYEELRTRHGVVVAMDTDRNLAYVLRWSGTEPGAAAELGALAINRAASWQDFQAAVARWKMPAVEFVYADVNGHVGRHVAAFTPLRRGASGVMPVPAWTGEHDWRGFLPPGEQPSALDPPDAYVVSANGSQARHERIAARLTAADAHSVAAFSVLQRDVLSRDAERLVPLLESVRGERPEIEAARLALTQWDRRLTADGTAGRTYVAWERILLRRLALLRIPEALVDESITRARDALIAALVRPSSTWFDGHPQRARDALALAALVEAVTVTGPGEQSGGARAPGLHSVIFAHPLGITPEARNRFNRGPFALPGDAETVFSVAGSSPEGMVGPSFRAIFDLADWDGSVATQAPGQSGSPASDHFSDLAESWAAGEYFPLAFTDAAVKIHTSTTLTLTPK